MTGRRITSRDLAKLGVVVADTRPRAQRMQLVLPFPISTNNIYRTFIGPNGRPMRAKTTAAKKYTARVVELVQAWAFQSRCQPPCPPYRLALIVHPPDDGRKHDASNTIKLIEDSIMEAIGGDDDNVISLYAQKEPRSDRPRVEVTLDGEGG